MPFVGGKVIDAKRKPNGRLLPANTEISDALRKTLKKRASFVGLPLLLCPICKANRMVPTTIAQLVFGYKEVKHEQKT